MGDGHEPEVLVLQPDTAAAPHHTRHLAHDAQRVGDVQDHGDRERHVEAAVSERQLGAVGLTQRDPAAADASGELARFAEDHAARVDPDDAPARAHQRGEVTGDGARAAAHLEDHVPGADGDEAQEPAPETRVARGARRRHARGRGGARARSSDGDQPLAARRAHSALQK